MPCKQVGPPGFFFIPPPPAEEADPDRSENPHSTTCSVISSPAKGMKGSQMHPLERSCPGYWGIPYFCRFVNPTAKKAAFLITDCATALPLRLAAVPVTSKQPPLPSMAGGYVNELHQIYFANRYGILANYNGR